MRFHQFSMKQLLVSMLGICCGLGGIAFGMRPIDLPLHPSYDHMAHWLPIAKLTALVTGAAVVCLSIIPLLTKRRPVPLLILMLVGLGIGLLTGNSIADVVAPNHRFRTATVGQQNVAKVLRIAGGAVGAVLPLILIIGFDTLNRPRDHS